MCRHLAAFGTSLLRAKGIPKILVAALLRETMYNHSTFVVNKEATSDPIRRSRSLMQGGAADPTISNCARDVVATKFRRKCVANGWGFSLDSTIIDIILFADNYWIAAKRPKNWNK